MSIGQSEPAAPDAAADPRAAQTAYFDGACPVCRREVGVYRKMRGLENIDWRDAAAPGAELDGLAPETALAQMHARRADGSLATGAAAFIAIWRRSPVLRPVAILLDRQPFLFLGEGLYRVFLMLRRLWR